MLRLFKIGNKVPGDPRYWLDGQLVEVRPSGSPIGRMERRHFLIIEDGLDYWKIRGDTDWKSTKPSVLEFKKQLYAADSNGKYPWEFGYLEEEGRRKRDWFIDPKYLLDQNLITRSVFDRVYDKNHDCETIYLDRDPSTYIFHEEAK